MAVTMIIWAIGVPVDGAGGVPLGGNGVFVGVSVEVGIGVLVCAGLRESKGWSNKVGFGIPIKTTPIITATISTLSRAINFVRL